MRETPYSKNADTSSLVEWSTVDRVRGLLCRASIHRRHGGGDAVLSDERIDDAHGGLLVFLAQQNKLRENYAITVTVATTPKLPGSREWIAAMEERTGLELTPRKRGPAPRAKS